VAGKRELGQLTAFGLVVLLIIRNVLPNAASGNDNSLGGGLLGAFAGITIDWLALRKDGIVTVNEASYTILEEDRRVSVIRRSAPPA